MLCVAASCKSANSPGPAALISTGRLLARHLLKALHIYFLNPFPFFLNVKVIICIITLQITKGFKKKKYIYILKQTEDRWALKLCKFVSIAHRHISKKWFISSVKRALSSFMACLSLNPPFTSSSLSVCHLSCCQAFTSKPWNVGILLANLCYALSIPHTLTSSIWASFSPFARNMPAYLSLSLSLFSPELCIWNWTEHSQFIIGWHVSCPRPNHRDLQ